MPYINYTLGCLAIAMGLMGVRLSRHTEESSSPELESSSIETLRSLAPAKLRLIAPGNLPEESARQTDGLRSGVLEDILSKYRRLKLVFRSGIRLASLRDAGLG